MNFKDLQEAAKKSATQSKERADNTINMLNERVEPEKARKKTTPEAFPPNLRGNLTAGPFLFGSSAVMKADIPTRGVMEAAVDVVDPASGFRDRVGYEGLPSALKGAYDEGRGKQRLAHAQAKERLSGPASLAYELGGAFTPGGAANRLMQGLEGVIKPATTFLGRMSQQSKIAGVEGLVAGFIEGQENPIDMATDGIQAYLAGGAGQALLGELAPFLIKYAPSATRSAMRVGDQILDTGPNEFGVSPAMIRGKYRDMLENSTGLTNTTLQNKESSLLANRIGDALAQAPFVKNAHAGNVRPEQAFRDYAEATEAVHSNLQRVSAEMKQRADDILAEPVSKFAKRAATNEQLSGFRRNYEQLSDTSVPGKKGARQVNYKNVVTSLDKELSSSMKIGNVRDLGTVEQKVWNDALHSIRPTGQHKNTGTLHRMDHDTTPSLGESVDLNKATVNLKNLLDARKQIASQLQPGRTIDGTTVTKEHARAGIKMVEALDKEIAKRTFGQSDKMRQGYAKYLKQHDANEMGHLFYAKRLNEDPDYGKNVVEYMESLSDDPDAQEAFKAGFAQSMRENIANNGALPEIRSLLGDVRPVPGQELDDFLNVKGGNLDLLRTVLGKDETDTLIRGTLDDAALVEAHENIAAVLKQKGYDPAAIENITRDGDSLLLYGAATPGQNSLTANATIAAALRSVKSLNEKDAALLQRLVSSKGADAEKTIEDFLKRVEKRSNIKAGGVIGSTVGEDETVSPSDERAKGNVKDTYSFLDALVNAERNSQSDDQ